MENKEELFVSVDVETSGPIPGEYSILSIGACVVGEDETFYRELKPLTKNYDAKALEVTGFSLKQLEQTGEDPKAAMDAFAAWLKAGSKNRQLVFVGLNAPFDWSFINYYFHKFCGENPFGFTALDIKALYMGVTGSSWYDTRSSKIIENLKINNDSTHNALKDAIFQGGLFNKILEMVKKSTYVKLDSPIK